MKLSIRAFSVTAGLIWCIAVMLVGFAHHAWPGYGGAFLEVVASIYPGYKVTEEVSSVLIGSGYALLDGLIGGLVFAWVYNLMLPVITAPNKQAAAG